MSQNTIVAELKRAVPIPLIGLLATAVVLLVGAGVGSASQTVDLANYAPNLERAATHELVATDGKRRLRFTLFGGGVWSRWFDDCSGDYQVWTDEGLVYLGFTLDWCSTPPQIAGMVPPVLVLPRRFDPATTWRRSGSVVVTWATLDPATDSWRDPQPGVRRVESTLTREELSGGESAIRLHYVVDSGYEESWWVVACIPMDTGGCARGIRRMQLISRRPDGSQVMTDVFFGQWVRRTDTGPGGFAPTAPLPSLPAPPLPSLPVP